MRTGIVVFAKAPVPGRVKTRLAPALGADGAAALAMRLLEHALAQALAARLGPVALCLGGGLRHPAVRALAAANALPLWSQGRGGLGRRMAAGLAHMQALADAALLIGTDAPAIDAAMLRAAATALQDHDAVFVPTVDGGYALVGLKAPAPALFDGMRWSHAGVMAETRERARRAGLRWAELPPVHDIDRPADLAQLPASFAPARR